MNSEKLMDLLRDRILAYEIIKENKFDIANDQPKNISWVALDFEFRDKSQSTYATIAYDTPKEISYQLVRFIQACFMEDILIGIATGGIKNLSINVGPKCPIDGDKNEGYEFKPKYAEAAN